MIAAALLMAATLLAVGCRHPSQIQQPSVLNKGPQPFVAPGSDPWVLTWEDPSTATSALLWNGLIGVRIGNAGKGRDADGKPLPFFMIDEYDTTGEEKIRVLPNPLDVTIRVGDETLTAQRPTDWRQSLDMRTGIVTTDWTEPTQAAGNVRIRVETAMHPTERLLGQRWTMTADREAPVVLGFGFAGDQGGEWKTDVATFANGRLKARIHQIIDGHRLQTSSPDPTIRTEGNSVTYEGISLVAGQPMVFERTVTFARSPNYVEMMKARGIAVKMAATEFEPPFAPEYQQLVDTATKIWNERWKTDIEIDGPIEDQQAVRSFLFYLRSAIHPKGGMSISPMGLSSDIYGGHVFWDADLWVMPALAVVDPNIAARIAAYRSQFGDHTFKNFVDWFLKWEAARERQKSGPDGGFFGGHVPMGGAKYPWESSVSGAETAHGPSQLEEHITGTVAFSQQLAAALGLADPDLASSIVASATIYYSLRSDRDKTGYRQLKKVLSPDENHMGDNDLYTNLLAQWCAYNGTWIPGTAHAVAGTTVYISYENFDRYYLPKDKISFLTYDNDPVKSYKQAAAVLAIYPLQYPPAEAQAKVMMDRFADKVIDNGPAMTDSVHAVIWARLGETDKAYETWKKGWAEFVKPPFLLFSEKRGQDRTYFTTGAAGELQSVIYGFLGFRIDSEKQAGAAWSLKLKGDRWLSIKPNLPRAWKRVTFRNFHVLGKTYTLTATHQSVQVTQGE